MRCFEGRVPPLEPGDRLTREEFERRFDATPGLRIAVRPLIEGELSAALAVLQQGTGSSDHVEFVERLGDRATA